MTIEGPIISVGMPVYNGGEWLEAAIESILEQTLKNFELIISDNASTDGSDEICKKFAAADSRIRYIRQPVNTGSHENYTFVCRAARSRYFKWASCSDICHETFLELCVGELEARPDLVLCFPRTRMFAEHPGDGQDYVEDLVLLDDSACGRLKKLLRNIKLNNVMNGVIRSDVLKKSPLMKPYFSSDVILMAEVSLHGKFAEIPKALYFRRLNDKSSTSLMSGEDAREHHDPQKKWSMLYQSWHFLSGFLSAALRAPLSFRERACVLLMVSRAVWWSRDKLAADLREAYRRWGTRATG